MRVEGVRVEAARERECRREREFFVDFLLVQIHFIIVMIRWTGLAPWKFEFPWHTPDATGQARKVHEKDPGRGLIDRR